MQRRNKQKQKIRPPQAWKCYVMSETIRSVSSGFEVRLKMVTNSGNVKYLDYHLWEGNERTSSGWYQWYFSNSQGYSAKVSLDTPIEIRILEGIDYFQENG